GGFPDRSPSGERYARRCLQRPAAPWWCCGEPAVLFRLEEAFMSRCLGLPTLDIDFLKATGFEFDVVGSSIEGGRNAYGETISIGITGGGLVRGSYDFVIHTPEQVEMINWLG